MPNREVSATAFIVVSQSETLARGVCEAVVSMAPNVVMASCGCHDEGLETATNLVKQSVLAMMDHLDADCSIVVMADFGAARMAVQKALTDLGNRNIVMGSGPLLEGFAAGVVAAQQGESLSAVLRSIASAAQFFPDPKTLDEDQNLPNRTQPNPLAPRVLELTNPQGMGPKSAAVFARKASEFDAKVTLNGADATSVLSLMGLHLNQGDQVTLAASGSQASIALEQLATLLSVEPISNSTSPAETKQEEQISPDQEARMIASLELEAETEMTSAPVKTPDKDTVPPEITVTLEDEELDPEDATVAFKEDEESPVEEDLPNRLAADPTSHGVSDLIRRLGISHLPK